MRESRECIKNDSTSDTRTYTGMDGVNMEMLAS